MYYNPYQQQYNPYAQNQNSIYEHLGTKQEIIKVNGENGARTYSGRMMPNSSALLLDETQAVVWLAQTDGAGYPNLTAYNITPKQEDKIPDYSTLDERITRLEAIMNESHIADASEPGTNKRAK